VGKNLFPYVNFKANIKINNHYDFQLSKIAKIGSNGENMAERINGIKDSAK